MLFDGIIIGNSVYYLSLPPLFPEKQNDLIFLSFAILAASIRFLLFPEVVNDIAISFLEPMPSSCLEKICSKL